MSWLIRHRLRRFVKYSFWLFPSLAILAAWLYGRVMIYYIPDIDLRIIEEQNIEGARAVIGALAASVMLRDRAACRREPARLGQYA